MCACAAPSTINQFNFLIIHDFSLSQSFFCVCVCLCVCVCVPGRERNKVCAPPKCAPRPSYIHNEVINVLRPPIREYQSRKSVLYSSLLYLHVCVRAHSVRLKSVIAFLNDLLQVAFDFCGDVPNGDVEIMLSHASLELLNPKQTAASYQPALQDCSTL